MKNLNKHHIVPHSRRKGSSKKGNIVLVNKTQHEKYHALFGNRTPPEILDYLVEYFWNGQRSWLDTHH